MVAAHSSETSVDIYQPTWRHNNPHNHRPEKLKTQKEFVSSRHSTTIYLEVEGLH
jgi:hypothetical protein